MENTKVMVVTADSHVGPLLDRQLREYCPPKHLREYDEFLDRDRDYRQQGQRISPESAAAEASRPGRHNLRTAGHHDVHARLRDMDLDGVAAEVIFHGSQNFEPFPFADMGDARTINLFKNLAPTRPDLAAAGQRMYNQWLADFCSVEPERHVGVGYIPMWDLEAAIAEMTFAREIGLRAVNFPCPQPWLPQYNKPYWEPLWAAACDLDMPLVTHFGMGSDADYSGVDGRAAAIYECVEMFGGRAVPWMIFGGVFERHPRLKLVITEVPGARWTKLASDLDAIFELIERDVAERHAAIPMADIRAVCPRRPSEYMRANLYIGASFMSDWEARDASEGEYHANVMWGSDYPHSEGTFHYRDEPGAASLTHLALRHAFSGVPRAQAAAMAGGNAAQVYGLDQ
jgi:predicted TIM-barrel fold metal-dependent hydrolase